MQVIVKDPDFKPSQPLPQPEEQNQLRQQLPQQQQQPQLQQQLQLPQQQLLLPQQQQQQPQQHKNLERKNSKMMQVIFADGKKANNDVKIVHENVVNHDLDDQIVINPDVVDQDDVQDSQRRKDSLFFDDFDSGGNFRRDFRKTSNDAAFLPTPTFQNFPPVTSSEKRATSYTRISFAKPANFNFEPFGKWNLTFVAIKNTCVWSGKI